MDFWCQNKPEKSKWEVANGHNFIIVSPSPINVNGSLLFCNKEVAAVCDVADWWNW